MKFQSMAKQLQRRMTLWSAFWFLVLWGVGIFSGIWGAKSLMNQELTKHADALVERIELIDDSLSLNDDDFRVNFQQPNSGFYYVIHAQRADRLSSASLDGFVLDLPRRLRADEMLFLTQGPQDQTVLVRFAEYQLNDRWLDVAVAQDFSSMQTALMTYAAVFSFSLVLMALIIILGIRRVIRSRFHSLPQGRKTLGLDSMQAELFNGRWPVEWAPMADRLHQALIQLRAKKVQNQQPIDDYAVSWPQDLELIIEPYSQSHPDKQIYLKYSTEPIDLLIDQQDMATALNSLLDNAMQWGRSQVWVEVTHRQDRLCVSVEDDGDGMAPERLEQIQQRTRKRETAEEDTGLKQLEEVVYAYQGTLNFATSKALGGLHVRLCFARPNLTDI